MGEIVRHMVTKMTVKELVLESAARSNILPVISTCNIRCKFCSHGQNPPDAETLKMPAISKGDQAQEGPQGAAACLGWVVLL